MKGFKMSLYCPKCNKVLKFKVSFKATVEREYKISKVGFIKNTALNIGKYEEYTSASCLKCGEIIWTGYTSRLLDIVKYIKDNQIKKTQ